MSTPATHASSSPALLCVLVSAPAAAADALASGIVEQRLAACVQTTAVTSCYRWNETVEHAEESLLIMKTTADAFPALEHWVGQHHPYEVPEIVALPVSHVHGAYGDWLLQNVGPV